MILCDVCVGCCIFWECDLGLLGNSCADLISASVAMERASPGMLMSKESACSSCGMVSFVRFLSKNGASMSSGRGDLERVVGSCLLICGVGCVICGEMYISWFL